MGRMAFRRILPIVQLALAAALVMLGNAQRSTRLAEWEAQSAALSPAVAEGATSGWVLPPAPDMPPPTEIAVGINAPALAGLLPVLIVLVIFFEERTWLLYLTCAIGILVFWYLVGVHVDRKRGLLPARIKKPPRAVTRFFAWAGLIVCPLLAIYFFKRIFELQGWHGEHDVYSYLGFSAWLMIASAALVFKLRQWQALAGISSSVGSG